MLEARFAKAEGKATDIDLYIRGAGGLRRLLETVGLQRRCKDITPPSVADYLAYKQNEGPAP
jgi:hypothetical protein